MRSILTTMLILIFGGPLFAADPPAAPAGKSGPFEGGATMNSADKANCKLAIRLAARLQCLKGKITRDELRTVLNATDNREAMVTINDHVQDMVLEQSFAGQKAGPRAAGGWLQWILDNFGPIMQMITQIIALFSQNMPADQLHYCALEANDGDGLLMFCAGPCARGQCTLSAEAAAPPAKPTPSATSAPCTGDALFSPG